MTLLAEHRAWKSRREIAQSESARECLRSALGRYLPGVPVWIYGSLLDPRRFCDCSDIDLAIAHLPEGMTLEYLQSLLSSEAGREVDVCLLDRSRLREQILATGEPWTP